MSVQYEAGGHATVEVRYACESPAQPQKEGQVVQERTGWQVLTEVRQELQSNEISTVIASQEMWTLPPSLPLRQRQPHQLSVPDSTTVTTSNNK